MCRLKHSPLSFSLTHTHSQVHCVRSWRDSAVPLFMCEGEKHKWLFYSLTSNSSSFIFIHPSVPTLYPSTLFCLPVLRSLHFWVLFTSLHFYLFGIVWFSAKGHHSLYESMHVSHYFLCGCSFCLPLSWCSIFWAGSLGYQCGGQQLLSNRWEHYHVKAKAMCCTPQQLERNV